MNGYVPSTYLPERTPIKRKTCTSPHREAWRTKSVPQKHAQKLMQQPKIMCGCYTCGCVRSALRRGVRVLE